MKTLNEWLVEAKKLRAAMYENEAAFYLFLVDGEQGAVDWKGAYTAFSELLPEIGVDVARYDRFREALKSVDRDRAKIVGVEGVIGAASVKDDDKRERVLISLEEARERRGVCQSSQEVRRIIQAIAPVERTPRDLARALSRDKLEQEVRSLRRENERLRKENMQLTARLTKLEGKKDAG
jgi:hypothetical protein